MTQTSDRPERRPDANPRDGAQRETSNVTRLLSFLDEGSLAFQLVRAYTEAAEESRLELLRAILEERLKMLRAALDDAAR